MPAKIPVAVILCLMLATSTGAEGLREYVYDGEGDLLATETSNAVCVNTLSSSGANISANGGSGAFSIVCSNSDCPWVATKNAAWITITGGSSGTGNGTVSYSVALNNGSARNGVINAAGQVFTIVQAAMTCQQSCANQATVYASQMMAACPNACVQAVISQNPGCAAQPSACISMYQACAASCQQQAQQVYNAYYQQCTASCQ